MANVAGRIAASGATQFWSQAAVIFISLFSVPPQPPQAGLPDIPMPADMAI